METDSKSKSQPIFLLPNIGANETRDAVDPKNANEQDRVTKLRVQKERQTIALQLVRQVTGLLQRTRLNVTVTCQAIHSKNARHMLLGKFRGWNPPLPKYHFADRFASQI